MDLSDGKSIEIADKALFDNYLLKFPPEISELTFTNLFIWRNYYNFLFLEWKDHLIILSKKYLNNKWKNPIIQGRDVLYLLPPIGATPELIILELIKKFHQAEFHKVSELTVEKIRNNEDFKEYKLEIAEDRDNWDYVHKLNDLIELPGNQYREKRRRLKKFLDQYNYEFHFLTEDLVDKCKKLQLKWCIIRDCQDNKSLFEEHKAINEALNNFNELEFSGALLCVDDECVAYTFGEKLNTNTLVIHIEKAHMQYEGSYQAINNLFLKNYSADIKFVNREQDLGILGLRRAKKSYKPDHMVKKSIVYQKD